MEILRTLILSQRVDSLDLFTLGKKNHQKGSLSGELTV